MSSIPAALHDFSNFLSVREVVGSAGLRGSELDASSRIKRGALVFLSNELRAGLKTNPFSAILLPGFDTKTSSAAEGWRG